MTQRAATALHVTLLVIGAILYFLFIIPRWWVLTGDMPGTLGTAGRIATGFPIALAAVPVVLNLQRSIKPAEGTPELALRLRAWSALLLVVAGALILVAAIAEIWLGLGAAGPWLFAVYGAAGATAVLGALAFWLAYYAEKPPAPPKPPKEPKEKTARRWLPKRRSATDEFETEDGDVEVDVIDAAEDEDDVDDVTVVDVISETTGDDVVVVETTEVVESPAGGLRNQRPTGKRLRLGRR